MLKEPPERPFQGLRAALRIPLQVSWFLSLGVGGLGFRESGPMWFSAAHRASIGVRLKSF